MSENERDTHFAGFANLHYPEISKLFFTMYARISELSPIEEIDALEDEIKKLIAQRAYDFAEHVIDVMLVTSVTDIPDVTQWPEQER